MVSIREIVVPENNKIELTIPVNFIGKRIEVLAFEIENSSAELQEKIQRPFKVANVKVKDYKFNRDEANEI